MGGIPSTEPSASGILRIRAGTPGPSGRPAKSGAFRTNDEIRYCLRSIHNYAPWVRTIWLVTDDQIPAAIDRQRAEQHNIRIVDHREIFRGYEQLLPTFNPLARSEERRVGKGCKSWWLVYA